MKFTNLKIQNFLSIGEAELSLASLGLVMIAGENLDETSASSNGAGKSSLADAISWCLWGKTARGVTGDAIVNTAAGKDTMVSIEVDDAGDLYRVERHRKNGKFKNGLFLYKLNDQGEWDDLTRGTNKLTQAQVERLLGCSEEVFNAAVYSGQEMMPDIPAMTDGQLKVLVEQAAGIDVLTTAYDIAKNRQRETASETAQAQVSLDRAIERHQDSKLSHERLTEQSNAWEDTRASKIDALKEATVTAKADFELGKKDLDPEGEAQLREEIEEIAAKIASVNDQRDRETVLIGDVDTAKQTQSTLETKITALETKLEAASSAVTRAEDALESVKGDEGKPCNECGRALEAEHLKVAVDASTLKVTQAKEAKQKAIEELAKAEARRPAAAKIVSNAEETLTKFRATMTNVTDEADKQVNLRRELQIVDAAKAEVERMRQAAVNAATAWKETQAETNPFVDMIEAADKELIDRAADIERCKKELASHKEQEAYAQAVVEVFSPKGVRAHRLDEATPYLNERTTHYLGSLADGAIEAFWTTLSEKADGTLAERFSVTVEKQGSAPSFGNLSGGEKRKVRLACALALQDLVATRAAKSIELWVGDEIDDALDEAGLERLMGVLEEKARERGSVLVISHNDIRDFARTVYTVTKSNGKATVLTS